MSDYAGYRRWSEVAAPHTIEYFDVPRLDPRLGRLVAHDSRSRAYALPVTMPMSALINAQHQRKVMILDQGSIGACTAFAGLGLLGTGNFYGGETSKALSAAGFAYNNASGVELYKRVTKIDEFRGAYPPDDTGSSGNAVGKLFKQLGFIKGWKHGFSLEAAFEELQQRPVITGVPWYSGMDRPDPEGFVKPSGQLKGGHEFVVDGINADLEFVYCTNSWGPKFGNNGTFKMTFATWQKLLSERGDITAFEPLAIAPVPPPQPPVPPVETELQLAERALNDAAIRWLKAKGYKIS